MSRDWASDIFARLYKQETDDDLFLSWEARAIWHEFLKRCDHRFGTLEIKRGTLGMSVMFRMPHDVVERALPELLTDGRIRIEGNTFVAPNYTVANYTPLSNGARKAAERARTASLYPRRDTRGPVDGNDSPHCAGGARIQGEIGEVNNNLSRDVTSSHTESRGVTACHSDSDQTQIRSEICETRDAAPHTEESPSAKKRARRIPEDWQPREAELRLAESLGLDGQSEANEFRDYWLGDGRPKLDWDRTFASRLRQRPRPMRRTLFGVDEAPRKIKEL